MRIDLFLKKCCIVKHRSFAKLACDKGRVRVDGVRAKPSKEVQVGSTVAMNLTDRKLEVEVLALPTGNVSKAQAQKYYRVLLEEVRKAEEF